MRKDRIAVQRLIFNTNYSAYKTHTKFSNKIHSSSELVKWSNLPAPTMLYHRCFVIPSFVFLFFFFLVRKRNFHEVLIHDPRNPRGTLSPLTVSWEISQRTGSIRRHVASAWWKLADARFVFRLDDSAPKSAPLPPENRLNRESHPR